MSKIVLDTSVIIDYIDERGSAHVEASLIFNELSRGNIFSFITHPTLAETYYVSYRIYKKIGLKEPLKVAEKLVRWLYMHPSIEIVENTFDLLHEVAMAKINFKLSLSDCYVLAASKLYNAKANFKKREKEMDAVIDELEKNYNILFLEDF